MALVGGEGMDGGLTWLGCKGVLLNFAVMDDFPRGLDVHRAAGAPRAARPHPQTSGPLLFLNYPRGRAASRDTLRDVMQCDRPPSPLAMRTQPLPSKRPRLSLRAKGPARSDLPEGQPPELEHSPRQRQQLRHWRMRERMHGWVGAVESGAHHARTRARARKFGSSASSSERVLNPQQRRTRRPRIATNNDVASRGRVDMRHSPRP